MKTASSQHGVSYSPASIPNNIRLCRSCHFVRPIREFRRRHRAGHTRFNQCRQCHNQAERLRKQHRRGCIKRHTLQRQLTALKNQRTTRGIEHAYLSLCKHVGGTEGLLRLWTEAMERDMAAGGFKAYRHIATILRLMQYCEDTQPNKPDYSQMSDEELLDLLNKNAIL